MRFKLTLAIFLFFNPLSGAFSDSPEQTTINASNFNQAKLEVTLGNYRKAHRLILSIIENDKQHYGIKHKKTAINLTLLATILSNLGQPINAKIFFLQSQNIARHLSNDNNAILVNNLFGLANIDKLRGEYKNSLDNHKKILNIRQTTQNTSDDDIIDSLLEITELEIILAQYDQAQHSLSLTEDMIRDIKKPAIYARVLNQKGLLAVAKKKYTAAEDYYAQALDIQLVSFSSDNPLVANTLFNIANRLNTIGNHNLAIPLYREAETIYANELNKNNLKSATTMNNMAAAYLKIGKNEQGMRINKKAYDMAKIIINDKHPFFAFNLINQANYLITKKQFNAAHQLYVNAKNRLITVYGTKHPAIVSIMADIENLRKKAEKLGAL